MRKNIRNVNVSRPQPPWLDIEEVVRIVAGGRWATVVGVETGYFGTLYRVRALDDGTEYELTRDDLESPDPDHAIVALVLES
jgi:hypothetical protein